MFGVLATYNYMKYKEFSNTDASYSELVEVNKIDFSHSIEILGEVKQSKLYPFGGWIKEDVYFTSITPRLTLNTKIKGYAKESMDLTGKLDITLKIEAADQWSHEIQLIEDKPFDIKDLKEDKIIEESTLINTKEIQNWIESVEEEINTGQSRYDWIFDVNIEGEAEYDGESIPFKIELEKLIEDGKDTLSVQDASENNIEAIVFDIEKSYESKVDYLGERSPENAMGMSFFILITCLIVEGICIYILIKIKPDEKIKIDKYNKKIFDTSIKIENKLDDFKSVMWISSAKSFVDLAEKRDLKIFFIEVQGGKKYFVWEEGVVYGYVVDDLFDETEVRKEYSKTI